MMKLLLLLVAVAFAAELKTTFKSGRIAKCHNGALYHLDYSTDIVSEENFINLDNVVGLTSVQCDIDSTRFLMNFDSADHLQMFQKSATPYTTFLTSFEKYDDCVPGEDLLLHRLIGFLPIASRQIEVVAVPARYDEVIRDGNVTLSRVGACENENDFVCLGFNTDPSCKRAMAPIPIYKYDSLLDIQCTNCFVGFHTEVFFNMKLSMWKLVLLTGGLKNIAVDGAVVLDLKSDGLWSAGVDKTFDIVKQLVVLKFNIGPIPVRIWFDVSAQIKAFGRFTEKAAAQVGATALMNIGNAYVQWTPETHWTAVKPTPKFTWAPVLSGNANFNAHVDFSLIPTIGLHVDNLFNYAVTLDPTLHVDVKGSTVSRQICADLTYDAVLSSKSDLKIDIPWMFIHVDKSWQLEMMNIQGAPIGHKCYP